MVVDYPAMSSVNFAIPDFCLLIPQLALAGNFLPKLHWKGLKFEFCWEDFSDRNRPGTKKRRLGSLRLLFDYFLEYRVVGGKHGMFSKFIFGLQ